MSEQYPGGFISKTPPTVTTSSAQGMWTLSQQAQYQQAGVWPIFVSTNYYIGTIINPTYGNATAKSVATDTLGNVYVCGYVDFSPSGGNIDTYLTKYSAAGALIWQERLYSGAGASKGLSVVLSADGGVIVAGYLATGTTVFVCKCDTSGSIQWQKYLTTSTSNVSVATDSSNNVFVLYDSSASGSGSGYVDMVVAKYNSTGTLIWNKYHKDILYATPSAGICVDTSDNIYICGNSYVPARSGYIGYVLKINSITGLEVWGTWIQPSYANYLYGITSDPSGNVIVCGWSKAGAGKSDTFIVSLNASGALNFAKTLTGATAGDSIFYSVSSDVSGNLYAVGQDYNKSIIAKYDSSGTVQWQRSLIMGASGNLLYGVTIDSLGTMHICGSAYNSATSSYVISVSSLPNTGSKTGYYTVGSLTFAYLATSLTSNTGYALLSSQLSIAGDSTIVSSSGALTAAATTLTSTVTVV